MYKLFSPLACRWQPMLEHLSSGESQVTTLPNADVERKTKRLELLSESHLMLRSSPLGTLLDGRLTS